ncbi:MAG: hypothetical protein CSA58_04695 [Micrococcales bacterium]|nr:MAG: hypothetical protein CSB46_04270 [Micrococcales bacterium]PIE27361.1 MAG: hypothetical protein CSA58_04695 [Micrococcales bacterium]
MDQLPPARPGRPPSAERPNGTRFVHLKRPSAGEAGMATAEYAIATLAAAGFAALLMALLSSGQVRAVLLGIIMRALSVV